MIITFNLFERILINFKPYFFAGTAYVIFVFYFSAEDSTLLFSYFESVLLVG